MQQTLMSAARSAIIPTCIAIITDTEKGILAAATAAVATEKDILAEVTATVINAVTVKGIPAEVTTESLDLRDLNDNSVRSISAQ